MADEKNVENKIKKYLDSVGAYHVKIHGSAFMPAGTPDILACINGRFVAIEVKKPIGGVVSSLQQLKIKQVINAGGVAFVARSVSDVQTRLQNENVI